MQLDTDAIKSKYCEKSPGDDPQGKNNHVWIDTKSDQGVNLVTKRNDKAGVLAANIEYRNIIGLIDKVESTPGITNHAGCIIELCTIAEVQIKWHDDFEEKLSLYELIIKRIREHSERL